MGYIRGDLKHSTRGIHTPLWENCFCVTTSLSSPGNAPLGEMQGTPLPNPNISFHLWTEDDQLCECHGGFGWCLRLESLCKTIRLVLVLEQ